MKWVQIGLVSQPKRDRLGHPMSFPSIYSCSLWCGSGVLRHLRPYTRVVCGVGLVSPPAGLQSTYWSKWSAEEDIRLQSVHNSRSSYWNPFIYLLLMQLSVVSQWPPFILHKVKQIATSQHKLCTQGAWQVMPREVRWY